MFCLRRVETESRFFAYAVRIASMISRTAKFFICNKRRNLRYATAYCPCLKLFPTFSQTFIYIPFQIFVGNDDISTAMKRTIDPPIVARFVRIYVHEYEAWPCMRIGLYGGERHVTSFVELHLMPQWSRATSCQELATTMFVIANYFMTSLRPCSSLSSDSRFHVTS